MKKQEYIQLPQDNEKKILGLFTRDKKFYSMFFSMLLLCQALIMSVRNISLNKKDKKRNLSLWICILVGKSDI